MKLLTSFLLYLFCFLPNSTFAQQENSIAVLPFWNQRALSESEDSLLYKRVVRETANLKDFVVVSPESTFSAIRKYDENVFAGCPDKQCLVRIGRELKSKFVLSGTVTKVDKEKGISFVIVNTVTQMIVAQTSRNVDQKGAVFLDENMADIISELYAQIEYCIIEDSIMSEQDPGISPLVRAYSFYLLQNIDSAVVYYAVANSLDPENIDSYYGLMNCYIARGDYRRAIVVGNQALRLQPDINIYLLNAYACGMINNVTQAHFLFDSAISYLELDSSSIARYQTSDLIQTLVISFKKSNNTKESLYWRKKGESYFPSGPLHDQFTKEHGEKNKLSMALNCAGSLLSYSSNSPYTKGYYYDVGGMLVLNQNFRLKAQYANTQIVQGFNTYGISVDSVTQKHKPTIYLYDTTFLLVNRQADDSTYDTIITKTNAPLWEQASTLKLYTRLNEINTDLNVGVRFSVSNMRYSTNAFTANLDHITHVLNSGLGVRWYFTNADKRYFIQASPLLKFEFPLNRCTFEAELNGHFISLIKNQSVKSSFPSHLQKAYDMTVGLRLNYLHVTFGAGGGERAFLNEEDGLLFHNTTEPYRYGIRTLIELYPFKFPLIFYYLYRKTTYQHYIMDINLAGVFVQW